MYSDIQIMVPKFSDFRKEIVLFSDIDDMTPVTITVPDPPNKNKVVNYKRPTSNQMWERIPLPNSFDKYRNKDKEEQYAMLNRTKEDMDFVWEEYKRFEKGYWFFVNGELTWISNWHYIFLNWWKIDIGAPKYKDVNRRLFLHWWKIENDDDCFGMLELTRRREGKSFRAGCIAYCRTFMTKMALTGIQSKTDNDAKKFFSKTVVSPWKKLPFFMVPEFDNSNNPREELRFYSPTRRSIESRSAIAEEDALESMIEVRSSVDTAFDGEKLITSIDDEIGKVKLGDGDVVERWGVKRECLQVDGVLFGKALCTSTVGEMERGGGDKYKTLWKNSDPGQKEDKGSVMKRTPSGLHRHFTPAQDGYIIDKYGRSLIKESLEAIEGLLKAVKGKPTEIARVNRQYPRTLKNAFRSMSGECRFNVEIINKRLEDFTFENKEVTWGNFKWTDGKQDTRVEFVPTSKENGKFCDSFLFPNPTESNKHTMFNGKRVPANMHFGVAGSDTFKYNQVTSNKPSQGSGVVFMERNPIIDADDEVTKWKTYRTCCTYVNRPSLDEYCEDMLMMCVYYGIKMFPEYNVSAVADHFEKRGYENYLLYQQKKNFRYSETPGASTNEKTISKLFPIVDSYIDNHGWRELHPEILEACLEADPSNLNPNDLFVAFAYALLGSNSNKKINFDSLNASQPLFQTFEVR